MPFESSSSWIRSIPDTGAAALLGYRRDSQEPTFIRYLQDEPAKRLEGYRGGVNLYKPLQPGEHEIHSSGYAQSYYSQRPILEQRGGIIRSWLDQDLAESGQKAPCHARQLHEHKSNEIGDEERFGVVRRPKKVNLAAAIVLGSSTSSNFHDYPYPNYTAPGNIPAVYSITAEGIGLASEATATLTGTYKIRPFGKEYLRVLKNNMFLGDGLLKVPLPPLTLVDIREGQVFDDAGIQLFGDSGAYLRAKHEYFTVLSDSTKMEIDDMGNVVWTVSLAAEDGWTTKVPFGSWVLSASKGISMSTLTSIDISSSFRTAITAQTDIETDSKANTTMSAFNFSTSAKGLWDASSEQDMSLGTSMNLKAEAAMVFDVKAGTQINLTAPTVVTKVDAMLQTEAGTQIDMKSPYMQLNADSILNAKAGTLLNLEAPTISIQGTTLVEAKSAKVALNAPSVTLGSAPVETVALGTSLTAWLQTFCKLFTGGNPIGVGNLGQPVPIDPVLLLAITSLAATIPTLKSNTVMVSV